MVLALEQNMAASILDLVFPPNMEILNSALDKIEDFVSSYKS